MNKTTSKKSIRIGFHTHGLGDVIHCATAMRLYIQRGYDVQIQVEPNKRWIWKVAGIPIYDGPGELPIHPYYYPDMNKFWDISTPDHLYSKIAHLFEVAELPKLGTKEEVWRLICSEHINAAGAISAGATADIAKFLGGLPGPIILLHSKGTNWQEEKSIPDATAFQLIRDLVTSFDGSVVVLDWDARAPSLGHRRVRTIHPYFDHMDTEHFGALCEAADLMIGVDSGPFHLAAWFDVKTLFVGRKIPPVRCCLPSPNATYLVSAAEHHNWAARGPEWNFAEFTGPEATAKDIVITALSILGKKDRRHMAQRTAIEPDLLPGQYTYHRVGHDKRQMELLPDGKIGIGAAGCERVWVIEQTPVGQLVTIYGDHGGPTCHLEMGADGVLRGRWLNHERMPIELIPDPGRVMPMPVIVTAADLEDVPDEDVADVPAVPAVPVVSAVATVKPSVSSGHPSDSIPDAEPNFYFGLLTYNRFDLLELAIEAVLKSTVLPRKIYVIDNSGGKWQGHPSRRIEIIRAPYNLGVARGFNVLQNLTQPSPLIVGADDVEVGPDLFEKMLAHPTSIVFADESRAYTVHMIRSEAWNKIGPWDGKFYPAYHEDNDYTMRAKAAGIKTGCPTSSGFIDHGPSATKAAMSETERNDLNGYFRKNRERYVAKWGGVPHLETFSIPFNGGSPS